MVGSVGGIGTSCPVCNAWEDYRTVVYKVTDNFTPVGTISTTNSTSAPVNLTQNLSKTQTVTMSVNGSKTETASFNLGGTQQYCMLNGTWSNPVAWRANVPIKNQVTVKLYSNPADSY